MKLQVKADPHQLMLLSGEKVIGHYTSILGLLKGAREALRKDKTKTAVEIREWIEKGIANEHKQASALAHLAAAAAQAVKPSVSVDIQELAP